MEMNRESLLVDLADVQRLLAISRSHAYNLIKTGHLKPVKIGRSTRFKRVDIQKFVEQLGNDHGSL